MLNEIMNDGIQRRQSLGVVVVWRWKLLDLFIRTGKFLALWELLSF